MLEMLRNMLWNYTFVPLFLVAGVVCWFIIVKNKGAERAGAESGGGEVSPVQTLLVTLASTIGTGNIVGVSLAISIGGAGSIFWMWVAAIAGIGVSYCENALGIKFRRKNDRPVGYMPKRLSMAFAFFCILSSFGIGNMIQSNSAADALFTGFGVQKWFTGAVFAILSYVIIKGGLRGITRFTDFFVPVMSVFYVFSAAAVMFINREAIPEVFESIFREAFSPRAIAGGAISTGIARGVLSGEAGIGSSVMLSSRSKAKSPHEQGLIGATAIFIDTLVICTLTAVVILSSQAASTQSAFYSALGPLGGSILDLSIAFFAFTTIVGWSYFGLRCTEYLFGEKHKDTYKLLYAAAAFLGAVAQLELVWGIGDVASCLMALPNLVCVIYFAGKIRKKV